MRWPGSVLAEIERAAGAARDGRPTLVAIEADAGMGKTTLLREVAAVQLDGFRVIRASGEERALDEPFRILREWGALGEETSAGVHAMQAARLLGDLVDRLQTAGPVVLVVDDVQWVDPESIDTVVTLLRRAAGDRLLVLAAHRPMGLRHRGWAAAVEEFGRTIRLDGIGVEAAADLAGELAPGSSPELIESLVSHAGGSPLYLRALLREHDAAELASLAARDELPAPAVLVQRMDERLVALDDDAARLLHALAVLGDRWSELRIAAAVGAVAEPEGALRSLLGEALVRVDRSRPSPRVRIFHSVIRAAVYDVIPPAARRQLHTAAAAWLPGIGDRLRHRAAAAEQADEGLARDLDDFADQLHEQVHYREASRCRRIAAGVSADPDAAERRSLDADFEAILARDLDDLSLDVSAADPRPHQRLIQAERLSARKEWSASAALLDAITDADLDRLSPLNAYRVRVVRAWTRTGAGRDPSEILPDLEIARGAAVQDPALRGSFLFAYGQALQSTAEGADIRGLGAEPTAERSALASSPGGMLQLSWRGSLYSLAGMTAEAIGDLSTVTDRIGDGALGFGDGVFHALLGFSQWMAGDWRRASISIGLPLSSPFGSLHPLVVAIAPLAALIAGEPAGSAIERSRLVRLAGPMRSAVHAADVVDVAVLGFGGTDEDRRTWLRRRTADFGAPLEQTAGVVPYLWHLVNGLGAAWAGEAAAVRAWAGQLATAEGIGWRDSAAAWLRALACGLEGTDSAGALLAIDGLPGLPSFEALLRVDAARAAADEHHADAATARSRAESALLARGAAACAGRLLPESEAAIPSRHDPLQALSDREREVVTLLLEGLSYAQIAKELYVTRSTVSFHLTNAYAKTNTGSRHELVQLVRAA